MNPLNQDTIVDEGPPTRKYRQSLRRELSLGSLDVLKHGLETVRRQQRSLLQVAQEESSQGSGAGGGGGGAPGGLAEPLECLGACQRGEVSRAIS